MRLVAAAIAALAALLVIAPMAAAHELREERAEEAAERYARAASGGSSGALTTRGPSGETVIQVTRYDSDRCLARGIHVRVCPVIYQGKDYLEEKCQDEPLLAETDPTEATQDCFTDITCRQTVTVTLSGHTARVAPRAPDDDDLSLRATPISCDFSGSSSVPTNTPGPPGPAPAPAAP